MRRPCRTPSSIAAASDSKSCHSAPYILMCNNSPRAKGWLGLIARAACKSEIELDGGRSVGRAGVNERRAILAGARACDTRQNRDTNLAIVVPAQIIERPHLRIVIACPPLFAGCTRGKYIAGHGLCRGEVDD